MKQLYTFLFLMVCSIGFGQIINEFQPNPPGTDPANVSIELKGTANAPFDLWILSVENDGINGVVDRASNVTGTFGANGLAVVTVPDLENPSFTVILTDNFTGSIGDDLDSSDSGTLNTSTLGVILDAVGISDAIADDATLYAGTLGGTDILYNGIGEPEIVFRDANSNEWYSVDNIANTDIHNAMGMAVDINDFTPNPTSTTFGADNPVFGTPLPITLEFFDGELNNNDQVELTWRTSAEINNDYFEIYRSTDFGNTWEVIGTKDGAGDSTTAIDYSFVDAAPAQGTNFYRLKQVDFDGTEKFEGGIVQINLASELDIVSFSRNQAQITFPKDGNALVDVYDMRGILVEQVEFMANEGLQSIELSQLPYGVYIIRVVQDGQVNTAKYVVAP